MTIHDLINIPDVPKDTTGSSCITALIDADSICYIIGWNYRDSDDTVEVAAAVDRFINDILVKTQASQYAGFFSDKVTFRHQLYPEYKAQRKDPAPGIQKWKPYITEYCIQMWNFEKLTNMEADDAVAELHRRMDNTVLCSPDKDLKQIPGNNFNYQKDQRTVIDANTAIYNWGTQMIWGDSTDNIKGIPKIGEKGAAKILDPLYELHKDSEHDFYEAVTQAVQRAYFTKFGDYEQYELHCKLIGLGFENVDALLPHLHTFDIENANPSEYLSPPEHEIGKDAEDLFGSW